MKIALLLVFLLTCGSLFAQAPDTLWTRVFQSIGGNAQTDWTYDVEQTSDGGYVATGRQQTGNWDIPLLKLDSGGQTVWQNAYGHPTYADHAYAVAQTANGGYALAGLRDLGHGQALVARINQDGTQDWLRVYPTNNTGSSGSVIFAINELPNGDIFCAGTFVDGGGAAPIREFFVMRLNSEGDSLWSRKYGGTEHEECRDAILTSDGNALLVGFTRSFGAIDKDVWVLKISLDGDSLWSRRYGSPGFEEEAYAVTQTSDQGYALTGYKGENLLLLKTNATGDSVTSAEYPVGAGASIQEIPGGDLSISGTQNNAGDHNFWLLRTSPTFNLVWSTAFGGAEENACQGHDVTADGGYVLSGFSNFGGNRQMTVVRYEEDRGLVVLSPNGGEEWTLFDSATVMWSGVRFDGNVSIELNRDYPAGEWEMLSPDEPNDGSKIVFVEGLLSSLCRVRVSALEDTFVDVSNANFSIVTSQGYLGLYNPSQPNNPVLQWNAGTLECPATSEVSYALKNFGNQAIQVFRPLEPPTSPFSRTISGCPLQFTLQPGEVSGCAVTLHFVPEGDGEVLDTLRIQSNASNTNGGFLKIPLFGEQISTPASPEVVITTVGEDAILQWSAVDTSIGGCPVSGLRYLVFYSPTSGGPFYYHGGTTALTYTHVWAVTYAPAMFYQVVAVKAPASLLDELEAGMEMGEVMGEIEDGKWKIEKAER